MKPRALLVALHGCDPWSGAGRRTGIQGVAAHPPHFSQVCRFRKIRDIGVPAARDLFSRRGMRRDSSASPTKGKRVVNRNRCAGPGGDWGAHERSGRRLARQVCGAGGAYPPGATMASIPTPESKTP